MAETSKAHYRRLREGWYERFIHDPGIDIGCHNDPIYAVCQQAVNFRPFDIMYGEDQDAQTMAGVPDDSYKTVYASHILEHLIDPEEAVRQWYRILMSGGYLIIDVPHRDMYEKKLTLPSNWNPDHKWFWLPERSVPPITKGVREVINKAIPQAKIVDLRILDDGFNPQGPLQHSLGEYSVEVIVTKPSW